MINNVNIPNLNRYRGGSFNLVESVVSLRFPPPPPQYSSAKDTARIDDIDNNKYVRVMKRVGE